MSRTNRIRTFHAFAVALLILSGALSVPLTAWAQSQSLGQHSIKTGTSAPSATTSHTISFDTRAASTVGSLVFEYCINDPFAATPCVVPAGLSVNGASIISQTGMIGFSIHANTTSNKLVLSRLPIAESPISSSYTFSPLTNPSTPNQTVYVRISTHASTDGTGSFDNDGGAVFTIQNGVGTQAFVPPFLIFCAAISVASDCSSSGGAYIGLGELSSSFPRSGVSQFAGATNDFDGYNVSVIGNTITSGNNEISPLASPTNSIPGTAQFGINLRANTNPSSGQDPAGPGVLTPTAPYFNSNQFTFVPGAIIASAPNSTNFNTMTVTYLVNVPSGQAPGVYSTTLTYIAFASF